MRRALLAFCLFGCATRSAGDDPTLLEGPEGAPPLNGSGAAPGEALPPPANGCAVGVGLDRVAGQIEDDAGLAVPGARAQLCVRRAADGNLLCLRPGAADATGRFEIAVPAEARCVSRATLRVVQPDGLYAALYCELGLEGAPDIDDDAPWVLFRASRGGLDPQPTPGGGQTVGLSGGIQVDVSPDRLYFGGDGDASTLGGRRISPADPRLCGTLLGPGFDGLYAFSPEADVDGPGFALRVPTPELAPGTRVAFSVLGGLSCTLSDGTPVPEGQWVEYGVAEVGADHFVKARGDAGLPCLTWLGWRALDPDEAPPAGPPSADAPGALPPPVLPDEPDEPEDPSPEDPPPPSTPPPAAPPAGPCTYPAGAPQTPRTGQVMPALTWADAYDADGSIGAFSMEDVFCDPAYARYTTIAFIVGAEWCPSCPDYIREVAQQASAIDAAGGLIVFVETEDNSYRPDSSRSANSYLSRLIADAPSIRVGDGDTRPARAIYNSPIIQSFPTAFVVRRSDMRVIADQNQVAGMLDFAGLARGGGGGGGGGGASCGPDDEEPYEPNDSAAQAARIGAGTFAGGVCDGGSDFYRVDLAGAWRLDLTFRHADGDLDVYVWDERTGRPANGANGRPLGSDSATDNESFQYQGPAIVAVLGYQGATAPYRLTLSQ
mgnify:CR=1 FL=1